MLVKILIDRHDNRETFNVPGLLQFVLIISYKPPLLVCFLNEVVTKVFSRSIDDEERVECRRDNFTKFDARDEKKV